MATEAVAFSADTKKAIEHSREARNHRARADRLAQAIYTEATGIKLPILHHYTDEETGDTYAIRIHAQLDLIEKGEG